MEEVGKVINGDFKKGKVYMFADDHCIGISTFWSSKIIYASDIIAYQLDSKPNDILSCLVILYTYKGKDCCSLLAIHGDGPALFESIIQKSKAQERADLLSIFGL